MRPVNLKPHIERRAHAARRSSRLLAQGLGSKASPPGCGHFQTKNPRTKRSRVLVVPIRNGASPVASALSIRSGATPRGPIHTNTPLSNPPSEPDISTLPRHALVILTPPTANYGALCMGNLSRCFPPFSDSASHRQNDPAIIWRLLCGVEHLHAVLPGGLAARLRLRALAA